MKRIGIAFALLLLVGSVQTLYGQSTIYVSPTGLDVNDGLTPGTAKLTIQAGINAAGSGGTVILAAGTYTLTTSVDVSTSVTIQGPNVGVAANTGSVINAARVAEAIISASAGGNFTSPSVSAFQIGAGATAFTIDGLKFTGSASPINSYSTGKTTQVVQNNIFDGTDVMYFEQQDATGQLTFADNRLVNMVNAQGPTNVPAVQVGVSSGSTPKSVSFTRNFVGNSSVVSGLNLSAVSGQISENYFSDLAIFGVLIAGPSSGVTIQKNRFNSIDVDAAISAGISLRAPEQYAGSVTITENFFIGNTLGIRVRSSNSGTGIPAPDVSNGYVTISGNSFQSTLKNVLHPGLGTLDMSGNWWGTNTPSGVAASINHTGDTGDVDYTPWLDNGTDIADGAGFQGDFTVLNVDDDGPQNGTTLRIQEAVNLAGSGTVKVQSGTYNEEVVISNSGLTVQGVSSSTTLLDNTGGTPKGAGNGFLVDDIADVTISGFGIKAANSGVRAGFADRLVVKNSAITNSIVGVNVDNSVSIALTGNSITSNTTGINLSYVDNGLFDQNTINLNSTGLVLQNSSDNNLVKRNSISSNTLNGIVFNGGDNNTIWNNTISGNGASSGGFGAGVYFSTGGGINNSVSANAITNNISYGIYINNVSNNIYDNVVAMNNISGNTTAGLTQINNINGYIANAQHNWWGNATGPTNATNNPSGTGQSITNDVVFFYHRSAALTLPIATDGPVFNTTQNKAYGSLDVALNNANSSDIINVRTAGLYEQYPYVGTTNIQLIGAGKNSSYVFMPQGYLDVEYSGSTVDGFDFDGGGFIDPQTGMFEHYSYNYSGNDVIEVYDNGVTVKNCRIRGGYDGIYTEYYDGVFDNNEIIWNSYAGIYTDDEPNTISNNVIYQNGDLYTVGVESEYDSPAGLYLYYTATVTGNTIANNIGHGLFDSDGNNVITGNTIGSKTGSFLLPAPINFTTLAGYYLPVKIATTGKPIIGVQRKQVGASTLNLPRTKRGALTKEGKKLLAEQKKMSRQQRAAMKEQRRQLRAEQILQSKANRNSQGPVVQANAKRAVVSFTIPKIQTVTSLPGNFLNGVFLYYDQNVLSNNIVKDNGGSFLMDAGTGYHYDHPAGVKTGDSQNLISVNTITNNHFAGVVFQDEYSDNVVWNNNISNNGFATLGNGDNGAGVYIGDGETYASISANIISNNTGYGIRVDNMYEYGAPYDNAVVLNNITGNTQGGAVVEDEGGYNYLLDAQRNWWGNASGPHHDVTNIAGTGQSVSDDIIYRFYRTTALSLPITTPGPVTVNGTVYRSISEYSGTYDKRVPTGGDHQDLQLKSASTATVIQVNTAGIVESYGVYLGSDDLTLKGKGKDASGQYLSYILLPNYEIEVGGDNVTIDGFDIDAGGTFDNTTGEWIYEMYDVSDYCVDVYYADGTKILNNWIRGSYETGIYMYLPSNTTIQNNDIFWHGYVGVYDNNEGGENNIILSNRIYEIGSIYHEGGGPFAGLALEGSSDTQVSGNNIFNNVNHGIYMKYVSGSTLSNNNVYNNGAFGYFDGGMNQPAGISMPAYNHNNIIENNVIANNVRFGLRMGTSDYYFTNGDNIIRNNTIGEASALLSVKALDRDAIIANMKRAAEVHAAKANTKAASASILSDGNESNFLIDPNVYRTKEARDARYQEIRKSLAAEGKARSETRRRERLLARSAASRNGSPDKLSTTRHRAGSLANSNSVVYELMASNGETMQTVAANWEGGISIQKDSYELISGNTVKGNGLGLIDLTHGPAYEPSGITLNNADFLTIDGNTILNNYSTGMLIQNNSSSNLITTNYITGNGVGNASTGAGVVIQDLSYANVLLGNVVTNNGPFGIHVMSGNIGELAYFNFISAQTSFGVKNESAIPGEVVDARYNFWGGSTGPGGAVNDPVTNKPATGTGNAVSANVLFDPFIAAQPAAAYIYVAPGGNANPDPFTMGITGLTLDFSNSGGGGFVVDASFNSTPPTGPFTDPSGAGTVFQIVNRYWEIVNAASLTGFTTDLTFSYNGLTIPAGATLRLARRPNFSGTGVPWVLIPLSSTTIDATNKTITAHNVTDFSQWTILYIQTVSVTSVNPSFGERGTTPQLTLIGSGFVSGLTTLDFGGDIPIIGMSVTSPTQLNVIISIPPSATLGGRTVTISNGSTPGTFTFNVVNPAPQVFSISPSTITRGGNTNITISGIGFVSGAGGTTLSFGSGITAGSVTINGNNQILAQISVPSATPAGAKSVTVSNSAPGGGSATGSITVTNPAPAILTVSPTSGNRGQTLTVAVEGNGFLTGTTTISFGDGVTVNSTAFTSVTSMQANITISPAASLGGRNVTVTNASPGGGLSFLTNGFTVNAGGATSVEMLGGAIPTDFALLQNYPNPFNPSTSIRFSLPERSTVHLALYNMLGVVVKELVNEELNAGMYQYRLDASEFSSGMYVYIFRAQTNLNGESKVFTNSRKLLLVK